MDATTLLRILDALDASGADACAAAAARNYVADAVRGAVPWETVEAALTQMETT